jgi:hypothetical protein
MNAVPPVRTEIFQNALTLLIDSVCAHFHAASLSGSSLLMGACAEIAHERKEQADALAALMQKNGSEPELESSREAGFQQIWMALVNRRFPTFRDGLPRECLRVDKAVIKALTKLVHDDLDREDFEVAMKVLSDVRASVARIEALRDSSETLPAYSFSYR